MCIVSTNKQRRPSDASDYGTPTKSAVKSSHVDNLIFRADDEVCGRHARLLVVDSAKDCQEGDPAEPSEREATGYPFTGRVRMAATPKIHQRKYFLVGE